MLGIRGLYEVALPVRELARAETFYREVLGLEVGLRDETRRRLFLRAGGPDGMVVLREDPEGWSSLHVAFTLRDEDLDAAVAALRERGVDVEGPLTHDWMPARSAYFSDPDGHALELCAPLAGG